MMTTRSPYGAWLVSMRKRRRISQQRLADETGIDRGHLSKIERGTVYLPQHETRQRIHPVLLTTEDELIERGIVSPVNGRAGPARVGGHERTAPTADAFPPGSDAARLVALLGDTDPALHLLFLRIVQGLLEMWQRQPWPMEAPAPAPVSRES